MLLSLLAAGGCSISLLCFKFLLHRASDLELCLKLSTTYAINNSIYITNISYLGIGLDIVGHENHRWPLVEAFRQDNTSASMVNVFMSMTGRGRVRHVVQFV